MDASSQRCARPLVQVERPTVAILGNGVQTKARVPALNSVIWLGEVRLWARVADPGTEVAKTLGATFLADAKAAVCDSDVVVCTTAAKDPILNRAWLKPGAFVSAFGWNTIDGRELDDATMANTAIVESCEAARDQAGNIRGSGCEVFADIGEIFAGTKHVPSGATIVYDSVGIAIMDMAAAKLASDLATA